MPEEEKKKLLILQTSGIREPRRTYAPLYIATTAAVMDLDVTIWFTMEGVSQLKKGAAEKIELVPGTGVTLQTWLDRARKAGVKFMSCAQAMEAEGLTVEDLVEGCEMAGAAGIIELSFEADQVMYF
ncbi:MAG: DsrE family protein [Actinobacteria bacterium]|nr:DsrE family protein [Actinomycetota bacterium]MCL5883456.1 DsrE family protein [Actinomycetota bacterium]